MKRILAIFAVLVWSVAGFAQESQIPQALEIAQVETDSGFTAYQVLDIPADGLHHYFLDVGTLGFGDEIIQVNIDPLFRLYIPLGDTLAEAREKLEELKDFYKAKPGTSFQLTGSLAPMLPGDVLEPVTVTSRKILLSRSLEFSVERDGYIRATYVQRSDFNTLVGAVKFYSKIHPKEK